jgi:hypothetical protein
MQVAFKTYFLHVTFDSSMCQMYSTKEKIDILLVRPLNIQWYLCYNFIHVYFIKNCNEKIGLNTILTSQFQTYLFLTFIIQKFLKFCSWFTTNPIEGSKRLKIWTYFRMFLWKTTLFNLTFFQQFFLYTLPCFHPPITINLIVDPMLVAGFSKYIKQN